MSSDKPLWKPNEQAIVPADLKAGDEIIQYAKQLSKRDINQIVSGYNAGSYEMVSAFVWTKAMAALKKQLATLGMDFIGEMLGRPDICEGSSADQVLTDHDAIRLAEDLGMLSATIGMRLKHALEVVTHFSRQDDDSLDEHEQMTNEDAVLCIRASVQSILGHPRIDVAVRFAEFRKELESKIFFEHDNAIVDLVAAPYFFKRTTLSVLIALVKSAQGAQLDNALANMNVVLPLIWDGLRKTERWQTGQAYSEIYNSGRQTAVTGLRKALMRVNGFDYVPENLRSATFSRAAQKLLDAHNSMNNFYTEPPLMTALATLGTSIPINALALCMRAILCVRLGNFYGYAFSAQDAAEQMLSNLTKDRWDYFLQECMPGDRTILDKLLEDRPRKRWIDLAKKYDLFDREVTDPKMRKMLAATKTGQSNAVEAAAREMIRGLGYKIDS